MVRLIKEIKRSNYICISPLFYVVVVVPYMLSGVFLDIKGYSLPNSIHDIQKISAILSIVTPMVFLSDYVEGNGCEVLYAYTTIAPLLRSIRLYQKIYTGALCGILLVFVLILRGSLISIVLTFVISQFYAALFVVLVLLTRAVWLPAASVLIVHMYFAYYQTLTQYGGVHFELFIRYPEEKHLFMCVVMGIVNVLLWKMADKISEKFCVLR